LAAAHSRVAGKRTTHAPSALACTARLRALAEGHAIATGTSLARELGNLPPNICNPAYLAEQAFELSRRHPDRADPDAWRAMWHLMVLARGHCDDAEHRAMCYEQWAGQRPHRDDYMPNWPESERTHYMMYEDTSEGTPISPAFATPEELAQWLADNGASAFGDMTADYDHWLRVARGGWAPGMVMQGGRLESGVQGL